MANLKKSFEDKFSTLQKDIELIKANVPIRKGLQEEKHDRTQDDATKLTDPSKNPHDNLVNIIEQGQKEQA